MKTNRSNREPPAEEALRRRAEKRVRTGVSLSAGASERFPSANRKIPNFSGYRAAFSAQNPGKFTEIIHPKQGDYACQQGENSAVLATFSVQIARFSRESESFARKSGWYDSVRFRISYNIYGCSKSL
jgi:hypothetical protein